MRYASSKASIARSLDHLNFVKLGIIKYTWNPLFNHLPCFFILMQLLLHAIDTFNANVVLVLGQVGAYLLSF